VHPPRIRGAAVLAAAVALGAPAAAGAAVRTVDQSKLLWATINACDTVGHPDTIGIRASMPGSGDPDEEMFMRFRAQFFNPADGTWHDLSKGGDSGFVDVGSGRYRAREAGRFFAFAPPTGRSYQLRGVVAFEWRKVGLVVRHAKKRTTAGRRSAVGADPPGFSAATCVIG
jgi:hypothetical protein